MFALITQGILNHKLPWILVVLGVLIAVVMELASVLRCLRRGRLSAALLDHTDLRRRPGPLFCRTVQPEERRDPPRELESEMSPGVLFSTGYIAGGTMGGLLIAFLSLAID